MSVTPAQTVGPYFSIGLPWEDGPLVVPGGGV
jgi:protocatechuate 3,4-dioxygenase, alpha subunit